MLQAGANAVVEPTHIGAEHIAQLILFPRTAHFLDGSQRMRMLGTALRGLGLELEVMAVAADSKLAGATIARIEHEAAGSVFVIAINRRDGKTITRPDPSTIVEAEDGVVLITRSGRNTPRVS